MKKIFEHIPGFSRYKVSGDGEVLGIYGKKLKPSIDIETNRALFHLKNDNGKVTTIKRARLVALAFLEIPENLKELPLEKIDVHHKDGNPSNDNVSNLLWVSEEDHIQLHKLLNNTGYKILQYKNGVLINSFNSINEAARNTGIPVQNISVIVNNKKTKSGRGNIVSRKTARGFEFKREYLNI